MDNCCNKGTDNFTQIDKAKDLLKAVSEPNRLRILCTLSKDDPCVCDLAERLNISRNLLSFHLRSLYKAGIVDKRRDGNKLYFFIKKEWNQRINDLFSFVGIT